MINRSRATRGPWWTPRAARARTRQGLRARIEDLEGRPLLATLAPIAGIQVPTLLGVRDVGNPGPSLVSTTATQTIDVGGGDTGAVRLVDRVLVIAPPGRRDSVPNNVVVDSVGGMIQVTVNGLIDSNQPLESDLDRIVVYGSKSSDNIAVTPNVTVPTTLSSGQGGNNTIQAGGDPSRVHVWYGRNVVTGGPGSTIVIGRKGHFRVQPGTGMFAEIFAGIPSRRATLHAPGSPPGGQFYRFVDGRLVPIPIRHPQSSHRTTPPRRQAGISHSGGQVAHDHRSTTPTPLQVERLGSGNASRPGSP